MKIIKLHYFAVENLGETEDLEETLKRLHAIPIEGRLRACGYQEIRLDDIQPKSISGRPPYWLMRFSRFRDDNWPSVATVSEPSKDLELDDDQMLAEETSALYVPSRKRLIIQYNHFGVRASKIQEYLSLSAGGGGATFQFNPILTQEAMEKYRNKTLVTSIEASVEGVSESDIKFFEGSGVEGALRASANADVSTFKFNFSVDARVKSNRIDRSFIQRLVDAVKGRAGDDDKLIVTARASEDEAVEVINLLEARKVSEFDAELIDRTAGRRYVPEQLYALLEQAYREWAQKDFR